MIAKILFVVVFNCFIIATLGVDDRFCNMLKNNISKHNAEGVIRTLNGEYLRYTEVPKTGPESHDSLTRKFEDCDIPIQPETIKKPYFDKPNKTLPVGTLNLRTVNSSVNIAIKLKHIKPVCTLLEPLLKILPEDSFNELYDPNETVMIFLFSYGLERERVINEWIVFFYRDGDIVDTLYNAKCLAQKDVREPKLKFKEKHILEYFKNIPIETPSEAPSETPSEELSESE